MNLSNTYPIRVFLPYTSMRCFSSNRFLPVERRNERGRGDSCFPSSFSTKTMLAWPGEGSVRGKRSSRSERFQTKLYKKNNNTNTTTTTTTPTNARDKNKTEARKPNQTFFKPIYWIAPKKLLFGVWVLFLPRLSGPFPSCFLSRNQQMKLGKDSSIGRQDSSSNSPYEDQEKELEPDDGHEWGYGEWSRSLGPSKNPLGHIIRS